MTDPRVRTSKFLSLVLRHDPARIGIRLDEAGWVPVEELLRACNLHGMALSREELEEVVRTNSKKRFAFSDDGLKIRSSQGHSVEIDLGYTPLLPPPTLYHGTARKFLSSIKDTGLVKGARHHVHLSPDMETAEVVGKRRGPFVVLTIDTQAMLRDGHAFYQSANGVWLTDHVPAAYIDFPNQNRKDHGD
jgi:putative RNA 2'-phosphotransferase